MRNIIGSTLIFSISTSTKSFHLFQAVQTNKRVDTLLCLNFCTLLLMSSLANCVCEPSLTTPSVSNGITPLFYIIKIYQPNYGPSSGPKCKAGEFFSNGGCHKRGPRRHLSKISKSTPKYY